MTTQLEQQLRSVHEKTKVELVTSTEPDMTKSTEAGDKNPFTGRIRKRTRLSCYLCSHYSTEVNDQRAREGKPADFKPKRRVWGKSIEGTPLIEHQGQLYLEYVVEHVAQVLYEVDGVTVPESLVEPWLKARPTSSRQGVDREIVIRTAKLANVLDVQLLP
jgi:hypothetical protein